MQGNRSRDTKPEMAVRRLLHKMGLRYRVSRRPLPDLRATADIVFPRQHIAVFIDGCFWHACEDHYRLPTTNTEYWQAKIDHNVERDRMVNGRLAEASWTVLRFWSHEAPESVAERVAVAVRPELSVVVSTL
jgi:DNA mismatch endonuclease (patch repair protein)